MRCIACNAQLPPVTVYRTILIAHPTLEGKTTTMRVEENCCNRCANKSNVNYYQQEESEDIADLGLDIPEATNYDY